NVNPGQHVPTRTKENPAMRIATAALVLALGAAVATAADAKASKARPVGTWSRTVEGRTLTFDIRNDDTLTVRLTDGTTTVEVSAEYGVTKDGLTLFGIITKVKAAGIDNVPGEGEQFRFRFRADKDTLRLSDLAGTCVNGEAKDFVEGEY